MSKQSIYLIMNNIMLLSLQESSISVKIVYSRGDFLLMKIPITLQETFVFTQRVQKKFIKSEIKKISSFQKINAQELKLQNIKLKNENKKLNKTISSIEKLQEKNQKLNSEKKICKIKNDLSELKSIKEKHEENYSLLKQNINTFTHEKIIRESQSIQARLMLKLSSMRLLLERSRNIELKDIYKN